MVKAFARNVFATVLLTVTLGQAAFAGGPYPLNPDSSMTPGELCQFATRKRYPENIKYCERDVDPDTKWAVIKLYVQKGGYNINPGNRMQFKIDHYIPLCMGGSNDVKNLWPQHQRVYELTDPMEPLLCEKMSMGKIKQAEAIMLIKKGKNDFKEIRGILAYVSRL